MTLSPDTLSVFPYGIIVLLAVALVSVLTAVLTDPDRAERWAALFWRLINGLFRRGELRIVAHDVAGNLNTFLNKNVFHLLTGVRNLRVRVEWVTGAKHDAFERRGTLIVKLRKHDDKYHNVLAATLAALPRILHPLVRPFLGERIAGAVDLQICRKLAAALGPGAQNVYVLDFLKPRLERDPELQRTLAELLQLDDAGLFVTVLLQELAYLGPKLQADREARRAEEELNKFIEFLLRIASKPPGEEIPLAFVQNYFRVAVILVSKAQTRALGVGPYIWRLGKDLAIGCEAIYLLASGDQVRFARSVAKAMKDDERAELEKEGEARISRLGKQTKGYFAAFKPNQAYLIREEFAEVIRQLGLTVDMEVEATAVNVDDEYAQLDVGGILARLDRTNATWKAVPSCRDILTEGDQVRVRILRLDLETREVEVGLKQVAEEDPWPEIAERYKPGTRVRGKITRVELHGVYVEIATGLEGLVHESSLRLAGYEFADFRETMVPGQSLDVVVKKVYRGKEKVSLDLQRVADR